MAGAAHQSEVHRVGASPTASCRLLKDFVPDHDAAFFATYDVFLCATLAYPPVRLGELALKPWERLGLAVLRAAPLKSLLDLMLDGLAAHSLERTPHPQLFNQTGQPAMSLPLYWNAQGLPIGTQFAARFGDEATLLRLASQLEQARPWASRLPPLGVGPLPP